MRGTWVVRLPTWLGDTIMAVPLVRALARATNGRVVLWGRSGHGRLLQATGIDTDLLPYRRPGGITVLNTVFDAVRALRGLRAAGVILLPNAFEPALLSALAQIPRRVGYATDGRGWLLTHSIDPPGPLVPIHDVDRYSALLEPLGADAPRADDILLEPPGGALHTRFGLDPQRPLLALVPGSANGPARQWAPARYAELAAVAAQRWGMASVLLGSLGDQSMSEAVQAYCPVECLDLVGQSDVLELAAVLVRCAAVVSNDTGTAHLAAALGCRTLVLFGPTNPDRTRPRGPTVRIARADCFCQPCQAHVCPLDHRCMTGLSTNRVVTALAALLETPATASTPS